MAYDPERERKARLIALRRLEEAHAIRARIKAGTAFGWERARLASLVHEARVYARQAREAKYRPPLPDPASGLSYRLVSNVGNTHR